MSLRSVGNIFIVSLLILYFSDVYVKPFRNKCIMEDPKEKKITETRFCCVKLGLFIYKNPFSVLLLSCDSLSIQRWLIFDMKLFFFFCGCYSLAFTSYILLLGTSSVWPPFVRLVRWGCREERRRLSHSLFVVVEDERVDWHVWGLLYSGFGSIFWG